MRTTSKRSLLPEAPDLEAYFRLAQAAAFVDFCHVLLNTAEFLTVE